MKFTKRKSTDRSDAFLFVYNQHNESLDNEFDDL